MFTSEKALIEYNNVMIQKIILHTLEKISHTFFAVLFTKLFVLMINLAQQLFFTEKKNAVNKFIEAIPKENDCRKRIKYK